MQLSHSRHVGSSGFSQYVSDSDIFDQLGVDTGPLDSGLENGGEQVLGKGIFEAALLVLGQGCSDRGADDNVVGLLSEDVFALGRHGVGIMCWKSGVVAINDRKSANNYILWDNLGDNVSPRAWPVWMIPRKRLTIYPEEEPGYVSSEVSQPLLHWRVSRCLKGGEAWGNNQPRHVGTRDERPVNKVSEWTWSTIIRATIVHYSLHRSSLQSVI